MLLFSCTSLLWGCAGARQAPAADPQPGAPQPHVLVYKTRGNYADLVPVTLSDNQQKIVAYPAPSDLRTGAQLAKPLPLHHGYLLDTRGIGPNTAFLNMSYAAYAALDEAPTLGWMLANLKDASPMQVICDCGPRSALLPGQSHPSQASVAKLINGWIAAGELEKHCKVIYGKTGR